MKKICKKIFGIMGTFLFSLWTKVFAITPSMTKNIIPDSMESSLYGVTNPYSKPELYWTIIKILLIPYILLKGIVVYLKRKDEKKHERAIKILKVISVIILIPLVVTIIILALKYIYYN